jgi:predicted acetyltransferase
MSESSEISLRLAQADELAIVAQLARLAFAPLLSNQDVEQDWYGGNVQLPGRSRFLAEDATGQLVGCYVQIELALWFMGQKLPILGIGGVAVALHRRGQGMASHLLDHALRSARDQQVPLTMLYPFQHGFYRSLGWAWVGETRQYRVSTRDLPRSPERHHVVPLSLETHQPGVQSAYAQGAIAHNGWLDRRDWQWEKFFKSAPGREIYCYIVAGEVLGYIVGQFTSAGPGTRLALVIHEWVALTPAAYRGLLGFLASLRDQISTIIWNTDRTDPFPHALQEQRCDPQMPSEAFGFGFTHRLGAIGSSFMWRLVDLRRALELRPIQPGTAFQLMFEVRDAILGDQAIAARFAEGHIQILDSMPDSTTPMLRLSVEQLTLLWSGVRRITELVEMGQVEVVGDRACLPLLDIAWQTQSPFCWDFF